jgi:hypothetical protein
MVFSAVGWLEVGGHAFEVQISTDVVEAPSYIILNQWLYFRLSARAPSLMTMSMAPTSLYGFCLLLKSKQNYASDTYCTHCI